MMLRAQSCLMQCGLHVAMATRIVRPTNAAAAILLTLAFAACGGGASNLPAPTPTPAVKQGLIAFARGTQGNQHIFVVKPDGSGLTQLDDRL